MKPSSLNNGRRSVRLVVKEPALVAREAWPVTTGVPAPRGALFDEANVRLLASGGQEIPCQTRVLSFWQDKSIRWLLLHFKADVPKGGQTTYYLEYGARVKRREFDSPLVVEETESEVKVSTGPLSLVASGEKFSLFEKAVLKTADGREEAVEGSKMRVGLKERSGSILRTLSIKVEEVKAQGGPLWAQIKTSGVVLGADGRRLLALETRIKAFAEKPFITILFTFTNIADADYLWIEEISLPIGLPPKKNAAVIFGTEEGPKKIKASEARLIQEEHNSYLLSVGDKHESGKRAPGWVDYTKGILGVTAGVRHFWQEFPKGLEVSLEGLIIGLKPKETEPLRLMQGVAKTTEIYLYFHPADESGEEIEKMARSLDAPLYATASAEWYSGSGASGDLAPRDEKDFPRLEKALREAAKGYLARREKEEDYGILNFGDFNMFRGGKSIWGNEEYDLTQTFCLLFAHSGDPVYLAEAEAAARHYMDVDIIHHSSERPEWLGAVHPHKEFHTGHPRITGYGLGHIWLEGLLSYYFLSGDERSFQMAKAIADFLCRATKGRRVTNERTAGWPIIALMSMYNATWEEKYLKAAKEIGQTVAEFQDQERGVYPFYDYKPLGKGGCTFKTGVLLRSLKLLHQATQDEKIARSIELGAHWLLNEAWLSDTEGFIYYQKNGSDHPVGGEVRTLPGLAYAYLLTKDEKILALANKVYRMALEGGGIGSTGKAFSVRSQPFMRYQSFLDRLGISEDEIFSSRAKRQRGKDDR